MNIFTVHLLKNVLVSNGRMAPSNVNTSRLFFVLVLGVMIGLTANGQTTFQKAFGSGDGAFNTKYDYAESVFQTSDGGYIVAGFSDGTGLGLYDTYMAKFDANGDTLWTRIYGGVGNDRARSVIETADGGYVVCGETESYGVLKNDALLFKVDSLGSLLWTKTFGGAEEDYASQVIETDDGGLMLVGRTESFGMAGGYHDIWAIKTDVNGVVSWTKTYGGSGGDMGHSIQQTTDGGYIIAGQEWSDTYGFLLLKINSTGDTSWSKVYRDSTYTLGEARSVKQTADGGYIVAGSSYSGGFGLYDMVLVKTDASGSISWARSYGLTGQDRARSVVEIPGSGYITVGSTTGLSNYTRLHAVRTDLNGAVIWDKYYQAQYANDGYEVISTTDGGFAMAGDIWNNFGNELVDVYQGGDAYILKTDGSGNSFGCQTDVTSLSSQVLPFWTEYIAPLSVSSGGTTNTPSMQESESLTNVYDAAIRMNFDITNVLCDTICAGSLSVDMCDSGGFFCSGFGPYTYMWSSNSGSQTGVTATGLCGGTYQITVTDASDCSGVGEAIVTSSAIVQELCIVTVDSTSTYNMVVWEKPITGAIDSFRIYREDGGGNYVHIGSNAYADVSEFVDNTSGVNPATTSYRYKISTVDTCGNESIKSAFHETIHLTASPGTPPAYNLIWDNYEGINFLYYRILRDSIGNGFFGVIDSVTTSNFTYTDISPPVGSMTYAIEIVHPSGCTSDKQKNWNSSKSNTSAVTGGALSSSATSNDATPGNCDGNATVTATGGTAPYTYAWSTTPVQTTSIITGLCQGTYTVTVTDDAGAVVTSTVLINESAGPVPASDFTATATSIAPGDSINFIDLSTNSPTSWQWIFTNGTPSISTDQNPTNITYTAVGCHDVTLLATNANGSGSEIKSCYIQVSVVGIGLPLPAQNYTIAPNPFEKTTHLSFTSPGLVPIQLDIYNLLGQKAYSYSGVTTSGDNRITWGVEQSGVYILKANIGDWNITEKVIKY